MNPLNPSSAAQRSHPIRNIAWVPYVVPFGLFMIALAIRAGLENPIRELGLDPRYLYALQVLPAAVALALFAPRLQPLWQPLLGFKRWSLGFGLGIAVFFVWIYADAAWMRIGEPVTTFVGVDDGALRWDLILLRCTGAVVLVPIIEEVFWRSFLMRWIDSRDFIARAPRATTAFALIASSAVFALAHDLWFAGFIAGVAYGWLYMRTGNLWTSVIAHATTNLALAIWVVVGGHWEYW